MPGTRAALPPEVARVSGLYRFIPPERFAELGIDPEDVPLGTFPAEDHPPFLPDRFGGNAYGLGLFEQSVLPGGEAGLIAQVNFDDPADLARNHRALNDIFKRLGLLVRYSGRGRPFYLIPRQYVAHFLVEVRARTDEIVEFLSSLLSRRLRESLKVGLVGLDLELQLPELQTRMPQVDFTVLDSLGSLKGGHGPFAAMVAVGDPLSFVLAGHAAGNGPDREAREDLGHFLAGQLWGMLEEGGELLVLADRPLSGSNETLQVTFASQGELKRFLMFSHVYRTRRRYKSGRSLTLEVNRFDFNTFLSGLGIYHETVEGLLEGRSLASVDPREIDRLPHQDLPLPRGSAKKLIASWERWFEPYLELGRRGATLPEVQRQEWEARYTIEGRFPKTLVVLQGVRRRPAVTLNQIESRLGRRRLAGCDRGLLAGYKDSFAYVNQVLGILAEAREGTLTSLPGLELSRLRKPFETATRHPALNHVFRLMQHAGRLARLEGRLNPDGLLGPRTPVLANLERLSLLGLEEGPLMQLYLIVLGHSTMSRVTFGKLPETTLQPLTELGRYRNLQEAVTILRLYRLLSVAEAAAASPRGLTPEQVEELFALYDDAIRVVTDPDLTWQELLNSQITGLGGLRAKALRKMLKLFDLFGYLNTWQRLERAGERVKEALADYDPGELERAGQVVELSETVGEFVERFYAGETSSRPFFFRALLNCELHGTGRLLPRLGARAGFTLLWICVHASERRLLNFNPLLEVEEGQLPQRLDKLRRALASLDLEALPPRWLASLREDMAAGRPAYIQDSGLYLTLDTATGALTPRFVDAADELERLEGRIERTLEQGLARVADEDLAATDRGLDEVARFLSAQGERSSGREAGAGRLLDMVRRQHRLARRLEAHLLRELFDLGGFAAHLRRLLHRCPRLMERMLPEAPDDPQTRRRLAAADKLSALHLRRLELFQDMQQSHEAARAEFGPTAAGIVGVSPLQFQTLTASLGQLLQGSDHLAAVLMMAVLLHGERGRRMPDADLAVHPLVQAVGLDRAQRHDLGFLLANHDFMWRVVSGQSTLLELESVLVRRDPPLAEALFLLSVVSAAASQEGLLTEDLLERFFGLLQQVRELIRRGKGARRAHHAALEEYARKNLAFEHYREIQEGEAPTASLRHLLDATRLPEQDRQRWLEAGRRQAGLDRLLKLRGLYFVNWLDVQLLRHQVPVVYIYRLKGLRSLGATHFERDLYEGLRLYRGLGALDQGTQSWLLSQLADPPRPLTLTDFAPAAERLTYPNQVRLLLAALAAAHRLELEPRPQRISFAPLARVMESKFEMVNEAITGLDPEALLARPAAVRRLWKAKEGLRLSYDREGRVLRLEITDPLRLDRKIEAVRRAKDVDKLKRLYHQELKRLKLTHYHTLDYGRRLEAAFHENLARLGEEMTERVRQQMAGETSLDHLERIFARAWEEGLELPLSPDRQQSLRDLFEMNVERIRAQLLEEVTRWLRGVGSSRELDRLWAQVKERLQAQRRHLGKDFDLMVAARFDRRARELASS